MPTNPDTESRTRNWIAILAVAGVAVAASIAGLRNQFVQDDLVLIVQNTRIHQLANWREIITSPYWPPPWSEDLYRPLTSLLLAGEYGLGGGSPLVFRIISYLLYAAAAVAVLLLARRLLPSRLAIGVALLFAAHPVHVEAVALGVGQNELLVGLLAAVMVIRYLDRRREPGGALGAGDWAQLGALYLAACLIKEHALVLPGLLLAAELFLLPGPAGPRVRRLAPGYGFLAATGVLMLLARTAALSGHVAAAMPAEALQGLHAGGRALTMLKVVPQWARLLIWPAHLQADYSPQEIVASTGVGLTAALGAALVLGAIAAAWLARRRAPVFSFGLAWVAIALLPVSNVLVPTGILLAERTLFLPSIGFLLAVGGLLAVTTPDVRFSPFASLRVTALSYWLVVTALVVAGVARSAERHGIWRTEEYFSVRSGQDAPRSYRTQKAYGYTLFETGRRELGIETYRRAIALAPADQVWRVRNDLARRYFDAGENRLAVEQLRASLSEAPDQEETRNYLILGYLALGAYSEAGAQADSALARGLSFQLFDGLRALADSALRAKAPPGAIRIRVHQPGQ